MNRCRILQDAPYSGGRLRSSLSCPTNGRGVSGVEYYGPGYEDSDLRIPSMRLIEQQLGWTPPTSLKSAMEATMKVFIEKYADKVQALKRTSDEAEPAAKKAKA